MPLLFNPQNVVVFASTVSPIFITFYFILEGAYHGHLKWIVWIFGLFIAIIFGILLRASGSSSDSIQETAIQFDNSKVWASALIKSLYFSLFFLSCIFS